MNLQIREFQFEFPPRKEDNIMESGGKIKVSGRFGGGYGERERERERGAILFESVSARFAEKKEMGQKAAWRKVAAS